MCKKGPFLRSVAVQTNSLEWVYELEVVDARNSYLSSLFLDGRKIMVPDIRNLEGKISGEFNNNL